MIVEAASDLGSLDKNTEALTFAIYLSAVISMTPQQCLSELGEEREPTLKRFRFATEQALARANFLNSQNTTLLQAAVLFLSCIRNQDESRFVWTLSAVVLRIATGLGLHRDGSNFGLNPLEAEIRRRIWWHICVLDVRAAEDHGTDPMIIDEMYDTHFPSNIYDEDISPDSVTLPPEQIGCTDMTFSLIRCEITSVYRQLTYIPPGSSTAPRKLEDREGLIERLNARLNERYIRHCDMQVPLQWVCATVARLIVAKLWMIVHHPLAARDLNQPTLSQDTRNRLLVTSIEIIEFSHLLERNESTVRWNWLFSTYIQWHAVAFVLAELCVRPLCPGVDRAWLAVNSVFHEWEQQATQKKKGMLWRPLAKLMKRATEFRKTQQEELRLKYGPKRPLFQPEPSPLLNTGVATILGVPQPDLASAQPTSSPSDPLTQASVLHTSLASPQVRSPPQTGFSLDLNKPMPELLNDTLQSHYYADPMMNLSGGANPYASNTTSDVMNTTITPARDTLPGGFVNIPLDWDQFDDVMRDFQLDIEQNHGPSRMGNMMEFF